MEATEGLIANYVTLAGEQAGSVGLVERTGRRFAIIPKDMEHSPGRSAGIRPYQRPGSQTEGLQI